MLIEGDLVILGITGEDSANKARWVCPAFAHRNTGTLTVNNLLINSANVVVIWMTVTTKREWLLNA